MSSDTAKSLRPDATCQLIAGGLLWEVAADYRDVLLGPDGLRLAEWLEAGQARVIKHGPHRTVYRVSLPEVDCYVKHCRVADGRAWLRECFRPPKAAGEYQRCLAVAARGVSTMTPLAVGVVGGLGPGESFFVSRTLDAEPLGSFIERTLPNLAERQGVRLRQRLAVALASFLSKLHDAGINHEDLHANNLLLTFDAEDEPRLYLIDLHAVRLGGPLSPNARRANLVVFNRWFIVRASRADRLRFWRAYRAPSDRDADGVTLEKLTWQSNLRFWTGRDRRCVLDNRYYQRVRSAVAFGHAVADLDAAARDALAADPDEPFRRPGVKLLKDSRSSTVAELDLPLGGAVRRVIYKRFKLTSWFEPLVALLRRTPALRSWVHGHGLRERLLPTPRPLLVLHRRRRGLAGEGYLLTEKVSDAEDLSDYVAGLGAVPVDERRSRLRSLVEQVARLLRDLHARQLSHRDLKAANILVQRSGWGPGLRLIDLVGVTCHRRLSRRRRVQNLTRLHVSFHCHPLLTRTDKLRFLRTYLAWGLHGKQGWKQWWCQVAAATTAKVTRNRRNGRVLT
jgi:tRNA A-37 threonylcarbamoyl transferase component Bud32